MPRRWRVCGPACCGAYRWQYILSGAQHPRFVDILGSLITAEQGERISQALAPLAG